MRATAAPFDILGHINQISTFFTWNQSVIFNLHTSVTQLKKWVNIHASLPRHRTVTNAPVSTALPLDLQDGFSPKNTTLCLSESRSSPFDLLCVLPQKVSIPLVNKATLGLWCRESWKYFILFVPCGKPQLQCYHTLPLSIPTAIT